MRTSRPADIRKTVQLLIILTLLAWATQTLLSQWGFGATVTAEVFVAPRESYRSATVELKADATTVGTEIKLKQIARWSDADALAFQQTGDLVIGHFERGKATQSIDADQVKRVLEGAGVNLTAINFSGALSCRVERTDPRLDPALESAVAAVHDVPATLPAAAGIAAPRAPIDRALTGGVVRSLREILTDDLARRLGLPVESLQVRFNKQDEKLVDLTEPHFRFEIEPRRQGNLGDVIWNVTITTPAGKQQVAISGRAQAWQTQLVLAKPLAGKQLFRGEDISTRRVLVDRLQDELSLSSEQVVGQQAARDLQAGMTLETRMIEPVQLARLGQLLNVEVKQGHVLLKWVAEAREAGTYGQTIRVRKPGTRDEFNVVLTGPQQGKLAGLVPDGTNVAAAR